jgi:TPR repeat protein
MPVQKIFYQAGLVCAAGIDADIDLVAAHKWFNLAASRGHEEAKFQRQEMAELLTSEEVKTALSAARDWLKLAH